MRNFFDIKNSQKRCLNYRRQILDISQQVSALHAAASFSAMEMVDCIFYGLMNRKKDNSSVDSFIMSKGHGCMVQYVILKELGILNQKDLDLYCKPEGRLGCHPDYGVPGIEASTGSLGHGMAIATGMAYTEKFIANNTNKIFVVLSDGELQEGSTWEAMMMAANLKVSNLVTFLDHNGYQSFGKTSDNHPAFYPIREKIEAFGWETAEVNGHNVASIYDAVISRKGDKPFMLIGNTVKGRGVDFMENNPIWHYRSPTNTEYNQAVNNLQEISS
tara:strand:- start:320 stop:1141 length:822 start_codon:yes stop_codon:yes gene_type:complete